MTRLKTFLALVLTTIVICTACQQGMEYDDSPKANIQALWDIIDKHYCYLSYKQETIGLDWEHIRGEYLQKVNTKMTHEQLFELMCNMLSRLQDGHVNLYAAHDLGHYWNWKEDYPANYDEDLQDDYLGDDYRIAAGIRYRILPDNIGYVVYRSFSNGIGDGNLDEVMYYLRACHGLIVDVRDNGGGVLTYAERLAQRFTNEKRLVGYICHKTGTGHDDFSSPEAEYLEPSKGVRWQKKAVFLTNRSCYSATNTLIRDVKECPLVTVMGDRTGGGGGLPFNSELPNGWSIRFSACPMFDAQMNQIEFGIDPDIPCAMDSSEASQGRDSMIEKARTFLNTK